MDRRTGRALWVGGTAIVWVAATLLLPRSSHIDALYSPLVALAALFVSPWYAAGMAVASVAAVGVVGAPDIGRVALTGAAVLVVWLASTYAARRRAVEHEDFERILALVRQVSSRLDVAEVPLAVVRTAREATDAKAASLRLLGTDGRTLEVRAAEGLSKAYMEKGPVDVRRSPIDRKALAGEIVQIRDVADDPRFQYPHEAEEEGIASVLCVPLRRKDAVIGVLRVYSGRQRRFTDREVRMLVALADHAVIALRHAELYQATLAFMRKVTHELRAPLAAIGSYLKILLEGIGGSLTQQQKDMLGRADRRTTLLLDAVGDLLSLSRARLERPAEATADVRLSVVLDSVVSLMAPRAERAGVGLELAIDEDLTPIPGSPEDMEELIGNLVSNAIKYTPEGGRVVAEAAANGECVILRVSDTGIGIPEDELPRLFDEFHRCENARSSGIEGTGLGMAIVKTIADRHRAEVRVDTAEGKGTTIEVAFPYTRA